MKLEHVHVPGSGDGAVVLFHGYGADMHDLAPLHRWFDPEGRWHWYFPNAPLRVPLGGGWEGRAWAPIDMRALEEAMARGVHRDMSGPAPEAYKTALEHMEGFAAEVAARHPKVVVGGFSQGAMGASHIAARGKVPLAGALLLSGTLLDRAALESGGRSTPISFFQSHGDGDALLGPKAARELHELFLAKGWQGTWCPFRGGHEIPETVLREGARFLRGCLD